MEWLQPIMDRLATWFGDLKPTGKWGLSFISLVLGIIFLFLFEWATGFVYYWNLERKVNLLQTMHSMSEGSIVTDTVLYPIYQDVAHELQQRSIHPNFSVVTIISNINFSFDVSTFLKWIGGASFGLLMLLLGATGALGKEKFTIVAALIFFGIWTFLGGYIATRIRTLIWPWVNTIVGFLVQFVPIIIYGTWLGKKHPKKPTSVT